MLYATGCCMYVLYVSIPKYKIQILMCVRVPHTIGWLDG